MWHKGPSTRCNDNRLGGDYLAVDLNLVGRNEACGAAHTRDSERGKPLRRIVWFDCLDHALYALHNRGEIHFTRCVHNAVIGCAANIRHDASATDNRLARHTAGVKAVASHPVLFDEHYFGLCPGNDQRSNEPSRTAADHDYIGVESLRLLKGGQALAALNDADQDFGNKRNYTQKSEGDDYRRRDQAA